MTGNFDVAARLDDARPAVNDTQTLVSAARMRGNPNFELDAPASGLEHWYGSEAGLDLHRLDADRAALDAATRSAAEALGLARTQIDALVRAWAGSGARAAAEFLRRHCDSAGSVVESLNLAGQACSELRDDLWRAVDDKVVATTAIADRVGPRRGAWLSAARAVLAGGADDTAAGIVDEQVKPFVDTAIGGDWLRDMQSSTAAAREAYRRAIERIGYLPRVRFEVPGDLGPKPVVSPAPAVSSNLPAAAGGFAVPAGSPQAPQSALSPQAPPIPQDVPPTSSATAPSPPSPPAPSWPQEMLPEPALPLGAGPLPGAGPLSGGGPPLGATPPGLPDLGVASGIPAQIADALGGLLDTRPAGLAGPSGLADIEPPTLDDLAEMPEDPADADDSEGVPADDAAEDGLEDSVIDGAADDPKAAEPTAEGMEAEAQTEAGAGTVSVPEPPPEQPADREPLLAEPAPEPKADPDCGTTAEPEPAPPPLPEPTPCEMAADELPQVGG